MTLSMREAADKTADVNVTNSSLKIAPPDPVTGGANALPFSFPGGTKQSLGTPITVSALVLTMTSDITSIVLQNSGKPVALFPGPKSGGNSEIVLPLNRPISFDEIDCYGDSLGLCVVGVVGNKP